MADKRKEPEAPGDRRRKRATPTIDLTATEVTETPTETPVEASTDTPAAPEPQADRPPAEEAAPASEPASDEPAPAETQGPSAEESAPAEAQAPPAEPETAPEPPRARGPATYVIALVSGVVGAGIVAGALAGLWYRGLLPLPVKDHSAQIAKLEQQMKALRNRPAPTLDNKAVDALKARVSHVEDEVAKLPPSDKTVSERLSAADNTLKSFGIALAALNHRNDDIATDAKQARQRAEAAEKAVADLRASLQDVAKNVSKNAAGSVPAQALTDLQKRVAALDALQGRVDKLEQAMKTARAQLAKNAAIDRAARLAVSAAELRDAVVRGEPFTTELAQAKSLGADPKRLAPLAPFAETGVPRPAALARDLSALMPAMLKAAGHKAAPGSFLDRLQANASKLVRIEPVTAPPGNTPSDVLARVQVDAAKADIAGALADLAKLPDAVRAPAQGWIAKAKARQQALAAARSFAADTAHALGKS